MTSHLPGFPDIAWENYPAAGRSFGTFLGGLWATACGALGVPHSPAAQSVQMVSSLLPAWSSEKIGITPPQQSYVSDDGFPAEISVNWSGPRPELRLLFDSLGEQWVFPDEPAGSVADLFPTAPVWHAIAWRPPVRVVLKTYYGLYALPKPDRRAAVGAAMTRLGLDAAWADAHRRVEVPGGEREIEFFAVDLVGRAEARAKVYYRNHDADLAEVCRVAAVASKHDVSEATTAYRMLAGPSTKAGRAALTCLAFRSGAATAIESTTYLRMPTLTASDQEAVDRTSALLSHHGVDPGRFRALTEAFAPVPLAHSTGLLELVSFRAAGRPADITTYFRFPVYPR
ncbi:hypothetical protein [Actinoplanes sp. NPDC049265]|uniref:hypothetical protein n=1 Tax=Actinoplanes sp. NPDC049265 TaxID=3363902 RepID=UPI003722AECA